MPFPQAFERWPVNRYWRGNPCQSAPASEQCREYTADLKLQSYGIVGSGAGLGQFFSEDTGLIRAGVKKGDWLRRSGFTDGRKFRPGLGAVPPGGPSFGTTLAVVGLFLGLVWLMKDPPKRKKRTGRISKGARKGVRRRKRSLSGYAA